jgi:RNA polymerase sigma-70 factor (ECF subfamily)
MERVLTEPTDAQLVRETIDGDREAYAELVRRHASRVYAVCFAILRDPDESEDAAQDALLKGMTQIHSLREGSKFAVWITQIAQNQCRDYWRVQRRRLELLRKNYTDAPSAPDASSRDIDDALERLPEKYRVPLMLYYFDGQSTENVAQTLAISRAGVGTRLARARRELRRLLEKNDG